ARVAVSPARRMKPRTRLATRHCYRPPPGRVRATDAGTRSRGWHSCPMDRLSATGTLCRPIETGLHGFGSGTETAPECRSVLAREPAMRDAHLGQAEIAYGLPPLGQLAAAGALQWVQLVSAGVPQEFCPLAQQHELTVTNLAGLYGPTIAEHTLALMLLLAR